MPERQPMTTRLKTLFLRPELFVLAGGINPIGAKMAQALGYDAFYMSGGNTSAHPAGLARFRDQHARHGGQRPENCPDRRDPGLRRCRHRLR
jgi:2-methylisocitrate lyase-like PEP mutase family enzyme